MDSETEPKQGHAPTWRGELRAQLQCHSRWLRTVLSARCGENGDVVDDLFQEVALAVVRQPRPLLDMAQVAPWLYQMAVRQALQYRRRAGRQRRRETLAAEQQSARRAHQATDTDPFNWLLHTERQQLVRAALAELRPRDREILLLKYTESWSYQQLANHLGISAAAVESRLQRARDRLRTGLNRTFHNRSDDNHHV